MSESETTTSETTTPPTIPRSAPAPNHCKACGHADPHDAPMIGAHSLRLCVECLRLGRYCTEGAMGYAALAWSRQIRISDRSHQLVSAASALDDMRHGKERVELEAAEWCERARVAEKRVDELVSGARPQWAYRWWYNARGRLVTDVDPAGVAGDRTAVTLVLSVEEYGRLTRELADAKARITELQEAATQRAEEQREEKKRHRAAVEGVLREFEELHCK